MAVLGETTGGASVILLLGVLGGLAAVSGWIVGAPWRVGELAGLLVADAAIAALLAIYVRLRTARAAMRVAGLAGAVGVLGFFGMSLLLGATDGVFPTGDELRVLLGAAPLLAGAIAAGGAGYLVRGIRRARTQRFST